VQIRLRAIETIVQNDLSEYIPYIEDLIWSQNEPAMMLEYLYTLSKFDSQNLINIANQFIILADNFNHISRPEDPLEMKVNAAYVMVSHGDYSAVNYAFEILNKDRPKVDIIAFRVLEQIIINHNTTYEIQAKNEFLYISENCPDEYFRYFALKVLAESYGKEFTQKCVDALTNSSDFTLRLFALEHLFIADYLELKSLLQQRLPLDSEPTVRLAIADSILSGFGTPQDLKFVKDYQLIEPNETTKGLMTFSISSFIPLRPELPIPAMIDSLDSYADQLFQFGWIKDESKYEEYKDRTENLSGLFQQNKIQDVCTNLNWILSNAQSQRGSTSLTQEGYKFLFYYTGYIKEKIEKEFGDCK
jgi:hypothetical protein